MPRQVRTPPGYTEVMPLRPLAILLCVVCLGGWAAQSATPKPRPLAASDLEKLRWIEGSWRGTGGGVPPFFERYRFENPFTLVVETLENDKVTSTSRYELRNGELGSGTDASRAVATALDDSSVTFAFAAPNRGGFKWERVNDKQWRAVITWPASPNRAAGERVYVMERIGK